MSGACDRRNFVNCSWLVEMGENGDVEPLWTLLQYVNSLNFSSEFPIPYFSR